VSVFVGKLGSGSCLVSQLGSGAGLWVPVFKPFTRDLCCGGPLTWQTWIHLSYPHRCHVSHEVLLSAV